MSSLPLQFLLLTVAGWMTRNENCITEYLVAENAVLREQLRGQRIRYTDAQRSKLAIAANKLGRRELSMLDTLVTPRTLLGWYRKLVAKKYDGTARRGPGGRRKPADAVELVLRTARENSGWGYTRIRGALFNINAANFATERDIMGFLWNVNTGAAAQRSSMDHIFSIYRHACNPSDAVPGICKNRPFIQWTPAQNAMGTLVHPGFAQGAQLEWGLGTPQSKFINQQARAFSVTPELPATP